MNVHKTGRTGCEHMTLCFQFAIFKKKCVMCWMMCVSSVLMGLYFKSSKYIYYLNRNQFITLRQLLDMFWLFFLLLGVLHFTALYPSSTPALYMPLWWQIRKCFLKNTRQVLQTYCFLWSPKAVTSHTSAVCAQWKLLGFLQQYMNFIILDHNNAKHFEDRGFVFWL